MSNDGAHDAGAISKRIVLLDVVRGLAIVGVVLYHFAFDLRLLELVAIDVTQHPTWVNFARVLSSIFLVLAGINLVQAHRSGMRWRAFWRRVGVIAIAALGISAITFVLYPDMLVYFGILHAIAAFSVLSVPFLRTPLWGVVAVALVVLALPFFFSDPLFNTRMFSWIGFWVVPPFTGDLVPIFPSFGLMLAGVVVARWVMDRGDDKRLAAVIVKSRISKGLAVAGRWSLIIYLVHQPLMLAVLYPVAAIVQPSIEQQSRSEAFYGACFSNCLEVSANATQCKVYCQCSLEQVEADNLWDIVNAPQSTAEQLQVVGSITRLCSAMAE